MSSSPTPAPTLTLDQAIQNAKTTEATYAADSATVVNIQTQIAQATSLLASAQETVASDVTAFNAALDDLIETAGRAQCEAVPPTAAKIPTGS